MHDLSTQLHEYGRTLDAEAAPLQTSPVLTGRPAGSRARPWMVATAAAAITMLIIGGAAWLLRGDAPPPVASDTVSETWTTWTAADGLVSECACAMVIADDGSVWLVGFDGVARFDGVAWERMDLPRPIQGEGWPSVATGPDGRVWVSGMSWIGAYRDGSWESIVDAGFGADEGDPLAFEGLIIDHEGRVWTGLADRPGIISGGAFVPADASSVGIAGYEPSWGIPWTVEPDGALWFFSAGAQGQDLRVHGGEVTEHILAGGIIGIAPDGSRWMGEYPTALDGETPIAYDLGGVRKMAFGADGTTWFLVHQVSPDGRLLGDQQWSDPGLYRLRNGEWRRLTTDDGLPGYRLSDMAMAEDGALWISTADGTVTRYQPGTDPRAGTSVEIDLRGLEDFDVAPPDTYPATTEPPPMTTVPTAATTVTTAVATTTTRSAATTTTALSVEVDEVGAVGYRAGDIVFTAVRDRSPFEGLVMTRQPNGIVEEMGWQSAVWQVHEFVAGSEYSAGSYLQVELHHLWPPDMEADVIWLTDYSGVTRNTLTGFTPTDATTFALHDALVLRGDLEQYALHPQCSGSAGDITVLLVSFERSSQPAVVAAWSIDTETMTLVPVVDASLPAIDATCGAPAPRS